MWYLRLRSSWRNIAEKSSGQLRLLDFHALQHLWVLVVPRTRKRVMEMLKGLRKLCCAYCAYACGSGQERRTRPEQAPIFDFEILGHAPYRI